MIRERGRVTIKAYHATSPEAFERILEGGAILPASMRVDPEALRAACTKHFSFYRYEVRYSEAFVKAIWDLIDQKANELQGRMTLWTPQADPERFHSHCFEYISGGTDFVYLQPREWEGTVVQDFSGGQPWGFVFDVEELLSKGALLFLYTLKHWMDDSIPSKFEAQSSLYVDVESAREFILETVDAFFRDNDNVAYGGDALKRLHDKRPGYLGWPGPLPIFMATEIWKAGRRVRDLEVV